MAEVSTFSDQLSHFREMSKAKIILWEESGAFDTQKPALIRRPSGHRPPGTEGLVWGAGD